VWFGLILLPLILFVAFAAWFYRFIRRIPHRMASYEVVTEQEIPPGAVIRVGTVRKRLERLGFQVLGWDRSLGRDASQPPRHLLVLYHRASFTTAEVDGAAVFHPLPARVWFSSRLQNDWELATSDGLDGRPPCAGWQSIEHQSHAIDLEDLFRDHLRFAAGAGVPVQQSSSSIEEIVAHENQSAPKRWETLLASGWVRQESDGVVRVAPIPLLARIPGYVLITFRQLRLIRRRAARWGLVG